MAKNSLNNWASLNKTRARRDAFVNFQITRWISRSAIGLHFAHDVAEVNFDSRVQLSIAAIH